MVNRYQTYRLGGDEFAMVLYDVHSKYEVQRICAALSQEFNRPFELHNGKQVKMTLSIGFALAWEHTSTEKLQELADRNMYQAKHRRTKRLLK
ncbi:Inner membrane protein YfiN [Salmonella bongori]|nr:Inner membrane protein YfiN [Salmonella bongori]